MAEKDFDAGDRTALIMVATKKFGVDGVGYKTTEIEGFAEQLLLDIGEKSRMCKSFPRTIAHGLQCMTAFSGQRTRTRVPNIAAMYNPLYDPFDDRFGHKSESQWQLQNALVLPSSLRVIRPGYVYALYGPDGRPIYFGKESKLHTRPMDHFKNKAWGGEATGLDQRHVGNEEDALAIETFLIRLHGPGMLKNIVGYAGDNPDLTLSRERMIKALPFIRPHAFNLVTPVELNM